MNEDLDELRSGIRKLLDTECISESVRAAAQTEDGLDRGLWAQLAASGWTSLGVSEDLDGGGASDREIAVVCEEIGRVLGPTLLSLTLTVSGPALSAAGTPAAGKLARRVAVGDALVVPVITAADGAPESQRLAVTVTTRGDARVLDGKAVLVIDADVADVLIVAARDEHGRIGVYLVDSTVVAVTPRPGLDLTRRLSDVTFDAVVVTAEAELHAPGHAGEAAYEAMVRGALRAITAEARGGLVELTARTVEYARVREQFGRPIGSFQAIKHRLADLYVAGHTTQAALAVCLSTDDALEVGSAKAYVTEAYTRVCAEALQIHGGIGYTWEHDVHLFLKRAALDAAVFGSRRWHALRAFPEVVRRAGLTEIDNTTSTTDNQETHHA
jgi:alkylation response protein AidB-like acyl-CoA dehydrogenase